MHLLGSLLLASFVVEMQCEIREGSVVFNNGKYEFKQGRVPGALAFGIYNDSIPDIGWGVLDITATRHENKFTGDQIMYAAGMLEGALTSLRIDQQYQNLRDFLYSGRPMDTYDKVCEFFGSQEKWMKMMIANSKYDRFWQSASFMQSQIEGLYAGYNLTGTREMSMCQMQILNGIGDLIDLLHVFKRTSTNKYLRMKKQKLRNFVQQNGHCSAIVKITPGFENLYMGHSSWFVYSAMLRIYKHYDLRAFSDDDPNSKLSFSSYPGFLNSLDDFYILGSNMVMLQTTNNIFNSTLYDQVVPQSLLAWQRVRVAHLLAHNGQEWGDIVGRYNSGTYNNQYMVIDLKKFKPNLALEDGSLYVVEQIPGLVESHDQTSILRTGYWASYNVPFYETIYNISGYAEVAEYDPEQSYVLSPRAKIFRRDQSTVVDMATLKNILRYNNYENDPFSEGDPCNSICCRGDLKYQPAMIGCYDTKVTDSFLARNFTSFAISGPTVGGRSNLPVFQWGQGTPYHEGMPDVFDFPFVPMKPKFFSDSHH